MNREEMVELGKMLVEVGGTGRVLERRPRAGFDWTIEFDQRNIDTVNYEYRIKRRSGECWVLLNKGGDITSVIDHPGASDRVRISWSEVEG